MQYTTDIKALICNNSIKNGGKFIKYHEKQSGDISIFTVEVSKEQADVKPGVYTTVHLPPIEQLNYKSKKYIEVLSGVIKHFLPRFPLPGKTLQSQTVLCAGLGSAYITADSLGPKTLTGLLATRHLINCKAAEGLCLRPVAAVCPAPQATSGISADEMIKSISDTIKPAAVVCIDSLCTEDICRLGTTVQISTAGITAAESVSVDSGLLGCPVIGIGVPTVLKSRKDTLMLTHKNADLLVRRAAGLVSQALNAALQPGLCTEEINNLLL